ncbi:MAG: DNA-3-methyladenine glycosylase II [Lasallia pustulata]|uniref:DNA-3-methyladenine glycosylase II n=1 Tax=Lasallia pustulata TaxID=136370 RepID=A0A5M8PKZ2_9LECA|nr:MAG: DNA-3-methyladenine glycosylase II [Lasallia pustulata]
MPSKQPPRTPTPIQVKAMATSYSTGDIDDAGPPPLPADRPAEPHRTNAPLKTPGGSRLVTYPAEEIDSSPSKTGIPRATTTTGQLLEEACAHLIKVEPKLKLLIEKHPCGVFSPEGLAEEIDPFRSLTTGIMSQQVSGAATKSIKNKFVGLFTEAQGAGDNPVGKPAPFPTPAQVAPCDVSFLRKAGLSERKAEYIKGLAEKFVSGELSAKMLIMASDDEVMQKLTAVRGLGKWSVEMFACFGLKRMDVFSTGDLGVQRGMAALIGKDVKKLKAKGGGKWKYMSEQDMLEHSAKFAPYRSLFMWYMWRIEDVDLSAIQDN